MHPKRGHSQLKHLNRENLDDAIEEAYLYFQAAADQIIGRFRHYQQAEIAEASSLTRQTLSGTLSGRAEWTIPKFAALCAATGEDFVEALKRGRDAVLAERTTSTEQAVKRLLAERTADLVLEVARSLPAKERKRVSRLLEKGGAQDEQRRGGGSDVPEQARSG